jgi:capsular exopolysaccharide synthesis family protein
MSNEMQQYTPFDGYGSEMAEYTPNAAMGRSMTAPADLPVQGGMVKKIHHSLRGRYLIGLAFGSVLAAIAGWVGYHSQHPIYRGEGMIRIAMNKLPGTLQGTAEAGYMPNFEEFLQSQAMMITSGTIIKNAMTGENWKATSLGEDALAKNLIATNLTVEHPSRTELIRVYYTDKNPDVAASVVKAMVLAYADYARTKNEQDETNRLQVLRDRVNLIIGTVARLDDQILRAGNEMGGGDLSLLIESKITEEGKLETQLHLTELALDAAKRNKDPRHVINELSERQIGMIDQRLGLLISEKFAIESQIASFKAAGIMAKSTKMLQLESMLEAQQKKINVYVLEWRDMQLKMSENPALGQGGIPQIMQRDASWLQGEVTALRAKFEEVKKGRVLIGQQMLKIQEFQRQRDAQAEELKSLQARIGQLTIEMNMASRLSILQTGDVPIVPFKDRRKMFCAAGVLGGFGLPMGLLMLIGLMDKRYRYSDETNDGVSNVPLLGILPRLPEKLSDPEQAAVAAHCIHQIRIMLQVGQNPDNRRTFMVTSASTGDGKTSLTMALGLSFAASGSKTLVIDCDMVGQGLTHRLKAHGVPGLIETLNLGTLRGHVRKTATKGLYILPIGNADAVHAGVLSPASIKRLMSACREHFDIIVIDTGPILGSLEASVVATEADGVIVAVARGQQQPLVEKAIKHLRSVGANLFGIVFNRAEERDFQRSVASASIRSVSAHQNEPRHLLPDSDESARFGPLARSVASCLPAASTHGNGNGHSNGNGHGE